MQIIRLLINEYPDEETNGKSTFEASYYIRYISVANKNQNLQQTFYTLNPWLSINKLFDNLPEAPADLGQITTQEVLQQTPFGLISQISRANSDIKWQYLYQEVRNYLEKQLISIGNGQNNKLFVGSSNDISQINNSIIRNDIPLYFGRKAISLLYYANMVKTQTTFTNTCELGIQLTQIYQFIQETLYKYFQALLSQLLNFIGQEQQQQLQDYVTDLNERKDIDRFASFLLNVTRPCLLTSVLYQTQELFDLSEQVYQIIDRKQVFECQQQIQNDLIQKLQTQSQNDLRQQYFIQKLQQKNWNDIIDDILSEIMRFAYFQTEYPIYGMNNDEQIANQQQMVEQMLNILSMKLQSLNDVQLQEVLLLKRISYMEGDKQYQIGFQLIWLWMLTWYNLSQRSYEFLIELLYKVEREVGYQQFQDLQTLQYSLNITFLSNNQIFIYTLPLLIFRQNDFTQQMSELAYKIWLEGDTELLESLCKQLSLICKENKQKFIYQIFNADLQQIINKCNEQLFKGEYCQNILNLANTLNLHPKQGLKQNLDFIEKADKSSIPEAIYYLNDVNIIERALQRYDLEDDVQLFSNICRVLFTLRQNQTECQIETLKNIFLQIIIHQNISNIDWRTALIVCMQVMQIQIYDTIEFNNQIIDFSQKQVGQQDIISIAYILQFQGFGFEWFDELLRQQKLIKSPQNQIQISYNQLLLQIQHKNDVEEDFKLNQLQQKIIEISQSSNQKELQSVKLQKLFTQLYILINSLPEWQRPSKQSLQLAGVSIKLIEIAEQYLDDEDQNIREILLQLKQAIE